MKKRLLCLCLLMSALWANAQVELDCAKLVFAMPGKPFVQKVRATDADAVLSVDSLPEGLHWNAERQMITGSVAQAGEYYYFVTMSHGSTTTEKITLRVSDNLQQKTPFMGLLTWNIFEGDISDTLVRQLADAMVDLGLREAGYKYLCLDDLWAEPERDAGHNLLCHKTKFPEGLAPLTQYVHDRGLKFGIYSDAGTRTCSGGQPGSMGFEEKDAYWMVKSNFDLLKYDYCNSAGEDLATAKKSYKWMGVQLQRFMRNNPNADFVYYLCEWGVRKPWQWGAEVGGTCWRATADTRDCWENPTYKGGVLDNIRVMTKIWQYNGVNRFNDADMMMCGLHGKGRSSNAGTDGSGMSQSEYRTQMVLWCMWSSPLTLCFDITTLYDGQSRIDKKLFNPYYKDDLAMITNADLIALDQDPLGQAAETLVFDNERLVLMKDLANGDVAISVTNMRDKSAELTIALKDFPVLDAKKKYKSKELISGDVELNLSVSRDNLVVILPAHGTIVWRFSEQ